MSLMKGEYKTCYFIIFFEFLKWVQFLIFMKIGGFASCECDIFLLKTKAFQPDKF